MIPKALKNFNLFIDGRGYAGRVEELTLPKLSIKVEEYRGGGMDVPVEIDMGMEKLECTMTLSEYDTDVLKQFGLYTGAKVPITLRGALDNESGTITPILVSLNGRWREVEFNNWKTGDKTTLKVTVAARYYRLEIDGKELIEIDIENMVRKIDGVDQLASMRAAIGV